MRLLLFDIDGTLLDTGGAGREALLDAGAEIFGVERSAMPPLDLAGATDGGVMRGLFRHFHLRDEPNLRQRFIAAYLRHLETHLQAADFPGTLLPGARDLVHALARRPDAFTLGLLTGNVRRGAALKLRRFDLHHSFPDGAFGDDADDRDLLGPVAVSRFEARLQRRLEPERVLVIGDTTKDVRCAAALGVRCLAVATGAHDRARLEQAGAWRCLNDLSDTSHVLDLLST